MQKAYDGLSLLVRNKLSQDTHCGDVFIFFNKREFDHVKIYKTYKKMVGTILAAVFVVIAFAMLSRKKRD
jgi:hypothetical protein